ncbi:hypothetical protein A3I57_01610 [Candidatus Beckwithbacteria bacterium RIFCSPLOWO2_02_FULL_47_23]|uniref:Uncharacterized protein n=2 Tax=Candidatus Beckwithiibacteriota TaxID=1752726 RepID=A0A1F5DR60_9BACT|nr:MAG: hypothetical protein A3E73_02335 [Candidatus Beckwithbacteria bacterium RIFCSPHIGHO2_12_FULL_47_17]OGD57658.1 MAG: hypothetical protein A3I57_01610 [Candidatus Beckwithbacteria bacterium RIFCSPLOWO2_02_FULL_47_23]
MNEKPVLDTKTKDRLNRGIQLSEREEFDAFLEQVNRFLNKKEPGSILELTREGSELATEIDSSWKRSVRNSLLVTLGTSISGDVSHPDGKNMKITYLTNTLGLNVGWTMNNGEQVYQLEFAAK